MNRRRGMAEDPKTCGHHDVYVATLKKADAPVEVFAVELICRECNQRFVGAVTTKALDNPRPV